MEKFIFLDMDGVLANFHKAAMQKLNSALSFKYTVEDYVDIQAGCDIAKFYNISNERFYEIIESDPLFWINIEAYPWAHRLYRELGKLGKVIICTSPLPNPLCYSQKIEWLNNKFKISSKNIILTNRKYLLAGSGGVLIDDNPCNCDEYTKAGGKAILVPSSWNVCNIDFDLIWKIIKYAEI